MTNQANKELAAPKDAAAYDWFTYTGKPLTAENDKGRKLDTVAEGSMEGAKGALRTITDGALVAQDGPIAWVGPRAAWRSRPTSSRSTCSFQISRTITSGS